jgi:Mrp family chromosome partitioning ATPase
VTTIEVPLTLMNLDGVKKSLERRYTLIDSGQHEPKVIVVVNGKGGVGKSSLSSAFGVALSKLGPPGSADGAGRTGQQLRRPRHLQQRHERPGRTPR